MAIDQLIRPNSSKVSLKSYITRFSSIFAIYGYITFTVGLLSYLLPIIGAFALAIYFMLVLLYTVLVLVITLGAGFIFAFDSIKALWSILDNTAELYAKFSEISIRISPIISGVSIGLLLTSLVLYILFAQNKKVKSIVPRSLFLLFAIMLLIFSLLVVFEIGVNKWQGL